LSFISLTRHVATSFNEWGVIDVIAGEFLLMSAAQADKPKINTKAVRFMNSFAA
jgi:hypothetical protein